MCGYRWRVEAKCGGYTHDTKERSNTNRMPRHMSIPFKNVKDKLQFTRFSEGSRIVMKEVGSWKWGSSRTSRSQTLGKENMCINMNGSINVLTKVRSLHSSEKPSASRQKTLDGPTSRLSLQRDWIMPLNDLSRSLTHLFNFYFQVLTLFNMQSITLSCPRMLLLKPIYSCIRISIQP